MNKLFSLMAVICLFTPMAQAASSLATFSAIAQLCQQQQTILIQELASNLRNNEDVQSERDALFVIKQAKAFAKYLGTLSGSYNLTSDATRCMSDLINTQLNTVTRVSVRNVAPGVDLMKSWNTKVNLALIDLLKDYSSTPTFTTNGSFFGGSGQYLTNHRRHSAVGVSDILSNIAEGLAYQVNGLQASVQRFLPNEGSLRAQSLFILRQIYLYNKSALDKKALARIYKSFPDYSGGVKTRTPIADYNSNNLQYFIEQDQLAWAASYLKLNKDECAGNISE